MKIAFPAWRVYSLTVALLLAAAVAQETPAGSSAKKPGTVVTLPFFVDGGDGNPVTTIAASDLTIMDGKKAVQSVVTVRTAKELPLRLGILIDESKSQLSSRLYRPTVEGVSDFFRHALSGTDDKVFVVVFSGTSRATGFMDQVQTQAFKLDLAPDGGTALYDAVQFACEKMKGDTAYPARRVLVLLSDGDDNVSHVTHRESIAAAQEAGTVIFAVSTDDGRSDPEIGERRLRMFASETGGDAFLGLSSKNISAVFAKIKAEVDAMYAVTYVPDELGAPGHFQPVELKVTDKKWKVHAPKRYYVPAARN